MQHLAPKLVSALPLARDGDGPALCRRFCRMFGRPEPDTPHGPPMARLRIPHRLRLKDGPYLCVCHCQGFAQHQPVTIRRPRPRGAARPTARTQETLQ